VSFVWYSRIVASSQHQLHYQAALPLLPPLLLSFALIGYIDLFMNEDYSLLLSIYLLAQQSHAPRAHIARQHDKNRPHNGKRQTIYSE
jgi:hypothetical protein